MPNHKETKNASTQALSRAQYRYGCIQRNPEFKENFKSLLFTKAVMAEQLKELRAADSPQTADYAAAYASNTELIDAGMRQKLPHLFKKPIHTVPFCADTTEEEWRAIYRHLKKPSLLLQQQEPKKRIHKDELAFRLQVFDSHQELKNFTQVGQRLGHAESNVRRAYDKVYFDIFAAELPSRTKERRAATLKPSTHMDTCPVCRAATNEKGMCKEAKAWVNEDVKASRETLLTDR
jgi:hypothetical protein